MPFVNNIVLMCSSESQVPAFVKKYDVEVVLHKDFIPEHHLPTFNANTIEMFMP